MELVKFLLTNWITREPTGSLWLAVATVLLFGASFTQARNDDERAWAWSRKLIESLAKALIFAAFTGMVYFLLSSNYSAFGKTHGAFVVEGSDSRNAYQKWRQIYGDSFFQQNDLEVTQYITVESVEPTQAGLYPVQLYQTVKTEQPVSQNDINRFRGKVTIQGADWNQRRETFNAYALSAIYEYDVVNPSDSVTRAEFRFPLFGGAKLYQDIRIKLNGEEVAWNVQNGAIVLEHPMRPKEQVTLSIQYSTWSMDGYKFSVQTSREVRDFNLTIALDTALC
jgi:hypothetical protein